MKSIPIHVFIDDYLLTDRANEIPPSQVENGISIRFFHGPSGRRVSIPMNVEYIEEEYGNILLQRLGMDDLVGLIPYT